MGHIIQWNCRGFKSNKNELDLLIHENNPYLICLQETLTSDKAKLNIKHFTTYSKLATLDAQGKPHGGVGVLVKSHLPQSEVNLNTTLQAVACKVTLHKTMTVCSLYIPPNERIKSEDLDSLINQLPSPMIIAGDFNAHNTMWGDRKNDPRGRLIEKFMTDHNLCLYNTGSFTYLHPGNGSLTAIDLTLCSPSLLLDYSWEVHNDQCGSDHFPIVINSNNKPPGERWPQWQFHKADPDMFQALCVTNLETTDFNNSIDPIKTFTETLHEIAKKCIPKSSANPKRPPKPWFNEECKEAITQRNKALRNFRNHPSPANLEQVKIWRAKSRRTIKQQKKESWQRYVSQLNSNTSLKKCWDMVRKIKGKGDGNHTCHLRENGNVISNAKDIANAIAATISNNSSSQNYSNKFQRNKAKKERKKLIFISQNAEEYNNPLYMQELLEALGKAKDTAPGPDDIHYQIIKHLPRTTQEILLSLLNNIWESGQLPPSWKEASVIPIPKPGKDHTNSNNYCPIALLSCICKIMERIVNARLVWFLCFFLNPPDS